MTQLCPVCHQAVETRMLPASLPVLTTQFGFQRDINDPVLSSHWAEPDRECKGSGVTIKEAAAPKVLLVRWTYPRPRIR